MSGQSSNVYVIDEVDKSLTACSASDLEGDIVRSPSFKGSSFSGNDCDIRIAPVVHRVMRTVGTNTEGHVSEAVNDLLCSGIMALMQRVAGDGFANDVLQKTQTDAKQRSAGLAATVCNALRSLREIAKGHAGSSVVCGPPTDASLVSGFDLPPVWLEELNQSIAKTETLLHEMTSEAEKVASTVRASHVAGLISAPAAVTSKIPIFSFMRCRTPSPKTAESDDGRAQELEARLLALEEKMAETNAVLVKEGVDSVVPLYNELMELRDARCQAVIRDAETTMAYLTTQECCFSQQLSVLEKRKRLLDADYNNYCCCYGEGRVDVLAEDIEKLEKLGRDLRRLRDEYQQSLLKLNAAGDKPQAVQNTCNKRLRTSEDSFLKLIEKQAQKEEEIIELRKTLQLQQREVEEWRQRYELATQSMSRQHENAVFKSLLHDIEVRLSQNFVRRSDFLCRLFGWELIDLNDKTVVIARVGGTAEPITLPIPSSVEEKLVMATSIVLAKKVLEGSGVFQGQCQEKRAAEPEQADAVGNQSKSLGEQVNSSGGLVYFCEGTPESTRQICGLCTQDEKPAETDDMVKEVLPEDDTVYREDHENSTAKLEPVFYNRGLWEEQ